jgi:hypothetical protein
MVRSEVVSVASGGTVVSRLVSRLVFEKARERG